MLRSNSADTAAPRPESLAYRLVRVGFFLFGFPTNGFGSFDITSRCNLRCRHCYYFAHEPPPDLAGSAWHGLIDQLRSLPRGEFPFLQASWVGGEPLLRADLVGELRRYFRFNTVVTNGTLALPSWPDVRFYVSVDGPPEVHDAIRDKPGLHARIVGNIEDRTDLNITIACCLNRLNAVHIEEMVERWRGTAVSHMVFDFQTPMMGTPDELHIPLPERDSICDRLIALRRRYGSFIAVPERTYRLMKSDLAHRVTERCAFRAKGFAFGADGARKAKCTLGPRADCSQCGCVVPYYIASLTWRRLIIGEWFGRRLRRPSPAIPPT